MAIDTRIQDIKTNGYCHKKSRHNSTSFMSTQESIAIHFMSYSGMMKIEKNMGSKEI
jgi:hypothetical protein